jgi:putative transposase
MKSSSKKGDILLFLDSNAGDVKLRPMPRTARAAIGGMCYHVLNRGNARAEVFHKRDDYEAFLGLLPRAVERLPMRILAYCVMPNHFHLVLWPHEDGDLGRFMQWLLTSHVRRYHRHYDSSGHVWQGRFKAFPIQQDEHYLSVVRYVERNPLRANLVRRAENWLWSSHRHRQSAEASELIHPGPVSLPSNWQTIVNRPQSEAEVAALRRSIVRGTPYGSDHWTKLTARRLDLESTLRPRGRPRKK